MIAKPLLRTDIERAMRMTKSNRAAARYLGVSYNHYKRYAKLFNNEEGKTLFEVHKNPSGKGIPKFLSNKGKDPALKDIIEGRIALEHFEPSKIRDRLILEGYLEEKCHRCGFNERRVVDYKMPLLLIFKDGNKKNWAINNLELGCYNCYFLYVGNIFNNKQIKGMEDYKPVAKVNEVDWELDDHFKEHFKSLGLDDDDSENDGSEFISRK